MKKILVFGGTRFFGKALVQHLIKSDYQVTIATRGITPDEFGQSVRRLIVNREDRDSIRHAFQNQFFDIVFDNICYSPNEAKMICEELEGKVGRFIFTSTMSVYNREKSINEMQFNPYTYDIVLGNRSAFTYGEGKRLAEAVFFQKAPFPVVAVRFPVVLGKEDYTRRLLFYCEHIVNNQTLNISDGELCFIEAEEAARFLEWIGENEYCGPINACSNGIISMKEIIYYIEKKSGKNTILSDQGIESPYNLISDFIILNDKARTLGFQFNDLRDYLFDLLDHYLKEVQPSDEM